ncbi:MAG: hypothetical protein IJT60_06540, partial [Clostridia bacterium]|nr:hypothetical protein [Clostridia bacterium]
NLFGNHNLRRRLKRPVHYSFYENINTGNGRFPECRSECAKTLTQFSMLIIPKNEVNTQYTIMFDFKENNLPGFMQKAQKTGQSVGKYTNSTKRAQPS